MPNANYIRVYGTIQNIQTFSNECCQQIMTVRTDTGMVNFIISPDTYVVNETRLRRGMSIAAFYDGNRPVPLIFPPQYQAAVVAVRRGQENIVMETFDNNLTAVNHSLQLNVSGSTDVTTPNGQAFTCRLGGRLLVVFYEATTRSIPPQTTPRRIIVMC